MFTVTAEKFWKKKKVKSWRKKNYHQNEVVTIEKKKGFKKWFCFETVIDKIKFFFDNIILHEKNFHSYSLYPTVLRWFFF